MTGAVISEAPGLTRGLVRLQLRLDHRGPGSSPGLHEQFFRNLSTSLANAVRLHSSVSPAWSTARRPYQRSYNAVRATPVRQGQRTHYKVWHQNPRLVPPLRISRRGGCVRTAIEKMASVLERRVDRGGEPGVGRHVALRSIASPGQARGFGASA